jgi:Phage tail lysozyme
MAGVTPKQVYQALTGAGASTVQAIGIMANSIAESGLNPEAVNKSDPNGGSYGFVQQNGASYASLVTGNAAADLAAQVKVVAQNGGFAAASGSTGAQAAGNFAANYERCVGCQPGGAQYSDRVANAATVEGWISSGNWPASGGVSSSVGQGLSGSTIADTNNPGCAWGLDFGGVSLPVLGSVGSVNLCVIQKTTIRHVVGGLLVVNGGLVLLVGAAILAASAFQKSGALAATQRAAAAVPGGGPAARAVSRGAARTARTAAPRASAAGRASARAPRETAEARQERLAGNRQARAAAGSQANQRRAVSGTAPRARGVRAPAPGRAPREVHH